MLPSNYLYEEYDYDTEYSDNDYDDSDNYDNFKKTIQKPKIQNNISVESQMITALNKNKSRIKSEEKKTFGKDINVLENSLNIFVGVQGKGKTFRTSAEIIKISKASKETHMLIYFNKYGEPKDETFEAVKHLIQIPIEYVSYNNAEEYVRKIQAYKTLYDKVKNKKIKISEKDIKEMMRILKINDFKRNYLHTLLYFEDFANNPLLKKQNGYFNEMFAVLRHEHCTAFILSQFWKGIPTEIKAQTTSIFVFCGYSRQQIRYILSQVAIPNSFEEIYDKYIHLTKKQCMIINIEFNTITFN